MAKRHQPKWEKHGVKEQIFNRASTELGQLGLRFSGIWNMKFL